MTDRGSVTLAIAAVLFVALLAGVAQTLHPPWVPEWMPGATVVLVFVGAAYKAWPALRRVPPAVRSTWRGLRWMGEVIDVIRRLPERLDRIERTQVDNQTEKNGRLDVMEQSIATMRVEAKGDMAEIRQAIVDHANASEESFGRLAAQTAGALAEHVATHHRSTT